MPKSLYNVKLEPEIKEKWQQIVESVMDKYQLDNLGDTYPVLIDIISRDSTLFISDSTGLISAVNQNLNAIRTNVSALQNNFLANLADAQNTMDESTKTFQKQLQEKTETINHLEDELKKANKKIEQLENEKQAWIKQKEILSILEEIKENTEKADKK